MLQLRKPLIAPRPPFGVNWNSEQARGLEYWWPGPEMGGLNALDLARNVRAIPTGMEALDAQRTQQGNRLWNFDNTAGGTTASEYFDTGIAPDANFTGMSFWVVFDTSITAQQTTGAHDGANHRWYLGVGQSAADVFAGVGTGFTVGGTASGFTVGRLHHMAVTFDGATARVYADGTERETFSATFASVSSSTAWVGARNHVTVHNALNGAIRDVRLFKYDVPTAATIAAMHNPATRFDLYWQPGRVNYFVPAAAPAGGRIMSSLAAAGGLAGMGGIAGQGGGLAG